MIAALILSGMVLVVAWMWLRLAKREVSLPIWSTLEIPELAEDESPEVSIVVTAHNQARALERCVHSLLRQDYPRFELIAVDEGSRDGTWERLIAIEAAGDGVLRVLRSDAKGAPAVRRLVSLQRGVEAARGRWLLFTTAETFHAPDLLSRAMAYTRLQGLGSLSLAPRYECRSFWEHVWQPVAWQYLDFIMPMVRVGDPASRGAWASDAFLLISREAYLKAGGHRPVASDIYQNGAVMQQVKSLGYRVEFVKAQDLLQTRPYRSFRELWQGWSKHLYPLLGAHPWRIGAHALNIWAWAVLPFAALVPAFSFGFWGLDGVQGWWDVVFAVCTILAVVTILQAQSVLRRVHRQNHFYTATLPLGGLCLGAAAMRAVLQGARRERTSEEKAYRP
jgi:chlorobactene glucosyltransferase